MDDTRDEWAKLCDTGGTRARAGLCPRDAIRTLERLRETLAEMPAPVVLMVFPMERGTIYVENEPGAVLKMKERVRVAFIHKDDVQAVQALLADAGLPPLRVVTADDMAPWEPEMPALSPMQEPAEYRLPLSWYYGNLKVRR